MSREPKHPQPSTTRKKLSVMNRRELLSWAPPIIACVSLPAHAQTSVCGSTPSLRVSVPSKCSGDPPVGEAVFSLISDAADPQNSTINIVSIVVNGASTTDTIGLPDLPVSITEANGADITWSGNASDAVSCLPLSTISLDIEYVCSDAEATTITFELVDLLAGAT